MSSRTTLAALGLAVLAALGALFAGRRRSSTIAAAAAGERPVPLASAVPAPREPQVPPPDDVTLTRRVETELFRSPEIPRGNVSVEAHQGLVTLHGEVDSQAMKDDLAQAARNVRGVREVRNELVLLQAMA